MLLTYQYPDVHELEHLNEYLFQFLTAIKEIPANTDFNPDNHCVPDFALLVKRGPKLKKKLKDFFDTFKALSQASKDTFYDIVLKSQAVQTFFDDDTIICSDITSTQITAIIGNNTFSNLMSHLFSVTLKGFDIHDHYKAIYDAMPHKVCPFCGVEKMHKSFQEDYDHLAAKKHYPMMAVHMKNLAPMCHTCNSKNKGEKDVLHNNDGTRRTFVYPYSKTVDITIDFTNCIVPQTNFANVNGNWDIRLLPNNSVVTNWDAIFNIKKRYREDYLESGYEDWLDDFLDGLKYSNVPLNTAQDVIDQLLLWSQTLSSRKFYNVNFIKAPLFNYLANSGINSLYNALIIRYSQKLVA